MLAHCKDTEQVAWREGAARGSLAPRCEMPSHRKELLGRNNSIVVGIRTAVETEQADAQNTLQDLPAVSFGCGNDKMGY